MGLEFRKSYYIGYLICENTSYNYHTRSSKSNEIEWIGITNHYYSLGHNPPSNSIVLCRTCRQSPTCLNLYNSQIYFAFKSKNLSCACIHLEVHSHLVNDGQCLEFLEAITGLIAHKVAKAPSTMFFYDPKFLKFGMFLLVQTLPILKLLSLKKMGPIYNQACPFSLDDFFFCLGYFIMFCGFILDQHMLKVSIPFGMAHKFVKVVRHLPKITAISGRVQGM